MTTARHSRTPPTTAQMSAKLNIGKLMILTSMKSTTLPLLKSLSIRFPVPPPTISATAVTYVPRCIRLVTRPTISATITREVMPIRNAVLPSIMLNAEPLLVQ